jgi:ribokinase
MTAAAQPAARIAAPKICVVGSAMVDQVARAPRLPAAGETVIGTGYAVGFGGKGSNQAVMAARLGAEVTMVAKLGRDDLGERTLQNYREQGIRTDFVCADEHASSGVAQIWVREGTGDNSIICVPGANLALTPADVRRAESAIAASAVVICQNEIPLECNLVAFQIAKRASVSTIYNPAPAADIPDELLQLSDILVPNEIEASFLTGLPTGTDAGAAAAALALRNRCLAGGDPRGVRAVIITLGSRGALILDDTGLTHVAAPRVHAVDTTGAGDAFVGSLSYHLARGDLRADFSGVLRSATQKSCLIATQSVLKPGTQTSFPYPHELPEACR